MLLEKATQVVVGGRYIPQLEEVAAKPCPSGGEWQVDLHTRCCAFFFFFITLKPRLE
jgi:hypothetical protein